MPPPRLLPVSRPWLPDRARLDRYIDGIYERAWFTNDGPLVHELTRRLENHLEVDNLLLVANGTLALQIAYRALGITPDERGGATEAITTPFTFIATASSLAWEGVKPVFVDIDPESWCLDPNGIEAAITARTRALVPVHVFGNPCEVERIQEIAARHRLKIIYDAAHAFGVRHEGGSILRHGDAATLSFHATKPFHTAEGGAIVFKRREDLERARKLINFGISGPGNITCTGINAKLSELHAALGLAMLDEIETSQAVRANNWKAYAERLHGTLPMQRIDSACSYNHAYFPVLLPDERSAVEFVHTLREHDVEARRYFYPSLDRSPLAVPCLHDLPHSHDVASRIVCLPLPPDLTSEQIATVIRILLHHL